MKGWGSEVISQRPGGWCAGGAQGTPFLQDTALPGTEQEPPQCVPCPSFSLPSFKQCQAPGLGREWVSVCAWPYGMPDLPQSKAEHGAENKI